MLLANDASGCLLSLPTRWNVSYAHSLTLIQQSFAARRAERIEHDDDDDDDDDDAACSPATYAALSPTVFGHPAFRVHADDAVLDIGAGDGILGAAAVLQHGARSAFGIELSARRVKDGCASLERLADAWRRQPQVSVPEPLTIELRAGDALAAGYGKMSPTRAVLYATCFPEHVSIALQHRLAAELPVGARVLAPGVRGWDLRLDALRAGRRQRLVNEGVATHAGRNHECCVRYYQALAGPGSSRGRTDRGAEPSGACEQTCLGDDMRDWIWAVEEVRDCADGDADVPL